MVHLCLEWWQILIESATRIEVVLAGSLRQGRIQAYRTWQWSLCLVLLLQVIEATGNDGDLRDHLGTPSSSGWGATLVCGKNWKLTFILSPLHIVSCMLSAKACFGLLKLLIIEEWRSLGELRLELQLMPIDFHCGKLPVWTHHSRGWEKTQLWSWGTPL